MNKKTKKLFKWEGWKKEIFWIVFFIFILLIYWSYSSETKSCKSMMETECYQKCSFEEGVKIMQEENPGLMFNCNYETKSCEVSGVAGAVSKFDTGGLNITFKGGDTNNTFTNP